VPEEAEGDRPRSDGRLARSDEHLSLLPGEPLRGRSSSPPW
jgi:hypothetical protein